MTGPEAGRDDDAMIRPARETAPAAEFQVCDLAAGPPFPDRSLDRVVAALLLHHLAMSEAFAGAGLLIERIVEPQPLPEMEGSSPDEHRRLRREPCVLFLRLVPAAAHRAD